MMARGRFDPAFRPDGCPLADDRVALIQQVKEANDIVDVVGERISLRPFGPTFKAVCPFHDDHRPSLDVDPRRQRYRCWACNQYGDVIKFVQEYDHIGFREALELLARRAGISLDSLKKSPHEPGRGLMLDVARWAAEQFQQCLYESPLAEPARLYLGERKLQGETVRRFGLGFAPPLGDWLVQKAAAAKMPIDMLETVGLVAKRNEGGGHYDRFRDRVIFPIRDVLGKTVGFGGRILPTSASLKRDPPPPKYYNSAETPLFSKSDLLYGIDLAKQAASKTGYLAIVEGYTDVMMAHQHGLANVVATMGTAFNARHIRKLRGVAQRVVLVFDADAGGTTGVDRALEVFVSHEMDLRIATLPEGLDPCDLLVERGPEPLRLSLEGAIDVFDFKLAQAWKESQEGVEGQRRAVEKMLTTLSLAPQDSGVKLELMVNRIAQRLNIEEKTVWARLRELRQKRADRAAPRPGDAPPPKGAIQGAAHEVSGQATNGTPAPPHERSAPAARHEVELLQVLLADGELVNTAIDEVTPGEVEHPGLRLLLEGLYRLHAEGETPGLDHLRDRLDNERLIDKAQDLRERGLALADRGDCLRDVLARFRDLRDRRRTQDLKNQVQALSDHDAAIEVLKRLKPQE